MTAFFILSILLFACTIIFYLVWYAVINYWHETRVSTVIIPVLFTFEFFVAGFLVIVLLSLLWQYLPDIMRAASQS